jgi:hypothetical protein
VWSTPAEKKNRRSAPTQYKWTEFIFHTDNGLHSDRFWARFLFASHSQKITKNRSCPRARRRGRAPRLHRRPPQHDVLRNEEIDAERGAAARVVVNNNRNQNGETLSPPSLPRRSYPQRIHNAAGLKTITEYERSGNDPAQMRSDRSGCLLLTPSEAEPRPRLQLSTTRGLQSGKPERREAAIFHRRSQQKCRPARPGPIGKRHYRCVRNFVNGMRPPRSRVLWRNGAEYGSMGVRAFFLPPTYSQTPIPRGVILGDFCTAQQLAEGGPYFEAYLIVHP